MKSKKGLLIYTLVLVLVCSVFVGVKNSGIKSDASGVNTSQLDLNVDHEISVMCQNLRREYTTKDGIGNNTILRYYRIVNQFNNYDSDIYCFQECTRVWQVLLDYTFNNNNYYKIIHYNNNGLATPVYAKKSRFDLFDSGVFNLSDRSSKDNTENRISCWAKLRDKKTGKTLAVYSGHYAFDHAIQVDSCEKIKEEAAQANVDGYIICGDFNFSKINNPKAYGVMSSGETKDLAIAAESEGIQGVTGGTFHDYGKETNPGRIDFFFGSASIVSKMYTVLNDTYDGKYVSDHYGILTYIDIK